MPTRYGPLDFRIRAISGDAIHIGIAGTITLPPGGLTIVPPLPEGKQIIAIETHHGSHAAIDPAGTSVVVTALPFAADLRLGKPQGLQPIL